MFKIGALIIIFCSILRFADSDSSLRHSICERRHLTNSNIIRFSCPEERIWFNSSLFASLGSKSDKKYCCGTIENRYCCKKSEAKRELCNRERSLKSMSSLTGTLFTIGFFVILVFICCKCLGLCFKKRRLQNGLVITGSTQAGTIHGQPVHVIAQPAQLPQPQPQQFMNPYQPPQTQYAPPAQYPYMPTPYPANPDYNQPPPPYQPVYPPPFKTENNQTSANTKAHQEPSAPDF